MPPSPLPPVPEKDKKMVRLHPQVKKELDGLVEYKGETYSDIIWRLIKHYKSTALKK
jgi:hypothetical protein